MVWTQCSDHEQTAWYAFVSFFLCVLLVLYLPVGCGGYKVLLHVGGDTSVGAMKPRTQASHPYAI